MLTYNFFEKILCMLNKNGNNKKVIIIFRNYIVCDKMNTPDKHFF